MSYKGKRTVVSMVAFIALLAAYAVYAIRRGAAGTESLSSWALGALVFLGISLVVLIGVQILFHVALAAGLAIKDRGRNPGEPERELDAAMIEDEMDRAISLRSARIGYVCTGIGVVAVFAVLAAGASAVIGLHVLLGALASGVLAASAAEVHGYERGVGNG